MKYLQVLRAAPNDAQQLEALYQAARQANEADEFKADLLTCHAEAPSNMLYTAWHYRFQYSAPDEHAERRNINWKLAIPLGLLNGLVLWALSDPELTFDGDRYGMPYLAVLLGPIIGVIVMVFLTLTAKANYRRTGLLSLGLIVVSVYVLLVAPGRYPYQQLMALHLPVLALAGVGLVVAGWSSTPPTRFVFLAKCIEAVVTAGVYLIATVIFAGIATAMFDALNIRVPAVYVRLMIAGGAGLLTLVAVATVYDPTAEPLAQDFKRGLSRMIATLPRVLLPLTLIVLIIYVIAIPFNFIAPFQNRDVLVIYNVMLFAVMALLLGATPLHAEDVPARFQTALRLGILIVAMLVVIVSLYALSATVYRTAQGGLTINRLTILGWNALNIALLVVMIYRQLRRGASAWVESLHFTFSLGAVGYTAWAIFVVVATPWLF